MILPILFALAAYTVAAPQSIETPAARLENIDTTSLNTVEDHNEKKSKDNMQALYEDFVNDNDKKKLESIVALYNDFLIYNEAEKEKKHQLDTRMKRQAESEADETESTTTNEVDNLEKEQAEEAKQAAEEEKWQERAAEESAAAERDGAAASAETATTTEDANEAAQEPNEESEESTPGPVEPDEDTAKSIDNPPTDDVSELEPASEPEGENDITDSTDPEVINVINDVLTPTAAYDRRPLVPPITYVWPARTVYMVPQYVVYRDIGHYSELLR